ncbi:hypothetical protein PINS_up008319 [Pythium insidiosum]|nr:hypothetical protein PINS_up008319 [Pythium insidiosum]
MELPDGVNGALEYYSPEMATTRCNNDACFLEISVDNKPTTVSVWNEFLSPPGYQPLTMYYRSAMLQSWNKFCFQGGMLEARVQLPGVVGRESTNPDLQGASSQRVKAAAFYPTWPAVWMMGNLGRALFGRSTRQMWPFSYSRCDPAGVQCGG